MTGEVLVLGATGTTGSRLVHRLSSSGVVTRAASRTPRDGQVAFDWFDEASWGPALGGVTGVYVVPPIGVAEPGPIIQRFLERASDHDVRRIVLLSSSAIEPSSDGLGAMHRLVSERSPEWAVLRPSWFMQNFTGSLAPASGLRAGRVRTATRGARIGFVDAADIAEVAAVLLLQDEPPDHDFVLTGPESLSFADVCRKAERVLGHAVEVVDLSEHEFTEFLAGNGVPPEFARLLAHLDAAIAHGTEDRVTDVVQRITGRSPRSVTDCFAEELRPA